MKDNRYNAILILGPTGSGKTPLGDLLDKRGLWESRCAHFDFGASLRSIADTGRKPHLLSDDDMAVITSVLKSGALLEDSQFHIAQSILQSFAEDKGLGEDDLLVLNGLPRHAGQADGVGTVTDVRMVVHLECTPDVVAGRIRGNTGGDRTSRIDDAPGDIKLKLAIFDERTKPLLDYYRRNNARVEAYKVAVGTTAPDIYEWLNTLVRREPYYGESQKKHM